MLQSIFSYEEGTKKGTWALCLDNNFINVFLRLGVTTYMSQHRRGHWMLAIKMGDKFCRNRSVKLLAPWRQAQSIEKRNFVPGNAQAWTRFSLRSQLISVCIVHKWNVERCHHVLNTSFNGYERNRLTWGEPSGQQAVHSHPIGHTHYRLLPRWTTYARKSILRVVWASYWMADLLPVLVFFLFFSFPFFLFFGTLNFFSQLICFGSLKVILTMHPSPVFFLVGWNTF